MNNIPSPESLFEPHLILHGYSPRSVALNESAITRILLELPQRIGTYSIRQQSISSYGGARTPQFKLSGTITLSNGHIALHTYPFVESDKLYNVMADIHSHQFDKDYVVGYLRDQFKLERDDYCPNYKLGIPVNDNKIADRIENAHLNKLSRATVSARNQ